MYYPGKQLLNTETLRIDLGGTNLRAGAGDTSSMTISDIQKIKVVTNEDIFDALHDINSKSNYCLLYTSPSPRDKRQSRMPSSA